MDATISWKGKRKFTAIADSEREVIIDAKPDAGGEGQGVRPMELLLMGLGGCTGIDMIMILERMRLKVDRLDMQVSGDRAETEPQKYTHFTITYIVDSPDAPLEKVERAVKLSQDKYCSVAHSLSAPIDAVIVLNGERHPVTK